MKRNILSILTLVIAMFVAGWTIGRPNATPQQWEYTSTTNEKRLNEMGVQGWELCATIPLITSGGTFGTTFYLKRAKQ